MEKLHLNRVDLMDVAVGCLPATWRPWFGGANGPTHNVGPVLETFSDQAGPFAFEFDPFFLAARNGASWITIGAANHLVVSTGLEVVDRAVEIGKPIWMLVLDRMSYMVYYPKTLDKFRVSQFENKGVRGQSWAYIFFDEQHPSDLVEKVYKRRVRGTRQPQPAQVETPEHNETPGPDPVEQLSII
jgi:hypothetical protein